MNNDTDLLIHIDTDFNKKIMNILKELRKAINTNAVYFKKELKNTERNQEILAN